MIASVSSRRLHRYNLDADAIASLTASGSRGHIQQSHTVSRHHDLKSETESKSCLSWGPHCRIVGGSISIGCNANESSALHYHKIVENEHFVRCLCQSPISTKYKRDIRKNGSRPSLPPLETDILSDPSFNYSLPSRLVGYPWRNEAVLIHPRPSICARGPLVLHGLSRAPQLLLSKIFSWSRSLPDRFLRRLDLHHIDGRSWMA